MGQKKIGLGDFIRQVRTEIIEYQEDQKNQPAMFQIEEVELEAKVVVSSGTLEGKINIYIAELTASDNEDNIQTVRLKMSPAQQKKRPVNLVYNAPKGIKVGKKLKPLGSEKPLMVQPGGEYFQTKPIDPDDLKPPGPDDVILPE